MPTNTYLNLPEEKKTRILEAAIDEFAEHRFSQASINRIIKAAGIPRGSFYQYFSDKEDLYLLVIEKIGKEKLAVFSSHPAPSPDSTFLEAIIASVPAVLEWVERCPKYNQIGRLMAQDDTAFIQRIVRQMTFSQNEVLEYLRRDQQRGLIRADVDLSLVIDLVLPVTTTLLHEYYTQGGQERAIEKIKQVFDMIANGILAGKGKA